jgi:hypothetical protein
VKATLGDGTKVSQSTILSQEGQVPFFDSLYGKKGSILGWLTVSNSTVNGTVDWFAPAEKADKNFPSGFTLQTTLTGAKN